MFFLFYLQIEECCSSLESRLQGVGEVQSHVRDIFSRLADLDDELDSLSPVGRDADSLASQADALQGFLSHLTNLRTELDGHASECNSMLRREGSSPDLLALQRETEALSRQAGKVGGKEDVNLWCSIYCCVRSLLILLQLNERGQAKLDQVEDAADKVHEFYRLVGDLQDLLGSAEEVLTSQSIVGTEVEMIKQQLKDFKVLFCYNTSECVCPNNLLHVEKLHRNVAFLCFTILLHNTILVYLCELVCTVQVLYYRHSEAMMS